MTMPFWIRKKTHDAELGKANAVIDAMSRYLERVEDQVEALEEELADERTRVSNLEDHVAELEDEVERLEHALDDTDPSFFLPPTDEEE